MPELTLTLNQAKLSISENINCPLMVCSHERSGTHFLMNSIASSSDYLSNPFLDFDDHQLGANINFFSLNNIAYFFRRVSKIQQGEKIYCINSLIKSHFSPELLEKALIDGLKVAYIFRHPYNIFLSYWRLIYQLEWLEAPKTNSPLELAKHIPAGRSQKYQIQNYTNYFERWAMHTSSAVALSKRFANFQLIFYDDLVNDYEKTISKLFSLLNIKITNPPKKPERTNYILGSKKKVTIYQMNELKEFCKSEIKKYPRIPKILLTSKYLEI